ncbi:MAG TPA: glycosyltransferase family 39 protein [Verrucomicrobiae bacterium]|nr:glycosyltransferase family 39 protein [Verrucomicrobiae bacterium]
MESLIRKLASRPRCSILVLGLALLLVGNWILPMTDRDEARFSEASREMLQRADYIVPWFNGQWRFDKPILIYWCQSTCYRFLGENCFAARLPSVLFTTATALLLVGWGRRAGNDLTGFIAGAMFVMGLHVAAIGRIATADMAMVFFYTLAVWSGWRLCTRSAQGIEGRNGTSRLVGDQQAGAVQSLPGPSRMVYWLIFYVALALGFLAKGPEAWLPFGGIVLGRALRPNSFRLPWLETTGGVILTIALVACWGIPALAQTHGQFWKVGIGEHVIHRSIGVNDSHGLKGWGNFVLLLPLYFLTFIVSFLPWTIRKPESLEPWFQRQTQKGAFWRAVVPILRMLSFFLHFPLTLWRWWPQRRRDDLGWYLLVQALIVFVVFSLVRTKLPHYTMPAFPCLALWLALQLRTDADAVAWFGPRFIAMVLLIPTVMLGLAIAARHYTLTERLWQAVRADVRPDTKVGCFGYVEPSLVWQFRDAITNTVVLGDERAAKNFLTNEPPFILVLPSQDVASLPASDGVRVQVRGLDMVRFKDRNLTAIIRLAPGAR